jgi:aspartate carbamoyltransferase catalytic subunit
VVKDADVIMLLRIQHERLGRGVLPSPREYAAFYGLDLARLRMARPDVMVMHPGPINRGVEIGADVADSAQSVILAQVTNGIAVRMALLYLLLGSDDRRPDEVSHALD